MTSSEFERLKQRIAKATDTVSREKGILDNIKERLEKEFELHSIEEADEQISSIEKQIAKDKIKEDELIKKLEEAVDWSKV